MDPLLSHKQQRAADIRDAIREYHAARNPWGPEHRAHAVFLGVQRNNARRGFLSDDDYEEDETRGCCWYFGWLLLLVAACAAVWYTWSRAVDSANKLGMSFTALGSIGESGCQTATAEATAIVQVVNCTLIQSQLFVERLALVLRRGYDD